MVDIRQAQRADHDRIQQLWLETGLGRMSDEEWTAISAAPATTVLIATDAGKLVGSAVASFDGWRAYIYHVAVTEAARGKGVAKALMQSAEKRLVGKGARRIFVMVNENNTAGLALSTSMGYQPEGDVVLVKELARSS